MLATLATSASPERRSFSPALLILSGALSLTGMAGGGAWWKGHVTGMDGGNVQGRIFTLWTRRASPGRLIDGPVRKASESCTTSDECEDGTWCRVGDRRCWIDADCAYHSAKLGQPDMDCSRMPRSVETKSLSDICHSAEEGRDFPCNSVVAIVTLVCTSSLFAILASLFAWLMHPALLMIAACVSGACGASSVLVAISVTVPYSYATGSGLFLQVTALIFLAVGARSTSVNRNTEGMDKLVDIESPEKPAGAASSSSCSSTGVPSGVSGVRLAAASAAAPPPMKTPSKTNSPSVGLSPRTIGSSETGNSSAVGADHSGHASETLSGGCQGGRDEASEAVKTQEQGGADRSVATSTTVATL